MLNAEKFKYVPIKAGFYSLNHCGSWQHQLPKNCGVGFYICLCIHI